MARTSFSPRVIDSCFRPSHSLHLNHRYLSHVPDLTEFTSLIAYDSLQIHIGMTALTLVQGDITQQDTDAIVNAANLSLLGGGGVDGAIHRTGGPKILEECKAIRARQGGCATGEAVITTAGRLRAKKVIHTVGPVWQGGSADEDRLLANAYRNSLRLAVEYGLWTIAFPSISTGAYGFPIDRASQIAFDTVLRFAHGHAQLKEIRFVVFGIHDYGVYSRLFNATPA
jgi:O-acetyl-ADP-ribose deacetylase (regulator of RNase III)